ncbi:MAG: hypothetical protein CMF69_08515 [Magnetovibrio sp.]|nr:hypothetical protein [Magnetovibrio sp.]
MQKKHVVGPHGLTWLEGQVRHELDILSHNYKPWVPPAKGPHSEPVLDVLIVGGGLYGLGLAWGLLRSKVTNILVVDQASTGREGPWTTFARMKTLRTAKQLTGIEFGIPSVSVRAYWEAKFGRASWDGLDRIPRLEWMSYLEWYRRVLKIPVSNETKVTSIGGDANLVRVTIQKDEAESILLTRRLVLATGLIGNGGASIPKDLVSNLPADRWAHSSDDIDFRKLAGKNIGVLGAGASAFDNAITAVENNASKVSLFCRRHELPWLSAKKGLENAGFMRHFADLPDIYRWRFIRPIIKTPIPPPRHTVERALEMSNFKLCLGEPWTTAHTDGADIIVNTSISNYHFDYVIFGTGFDMDILRRAEMHLLAPHILCWRDRFAPPQGEENTMLLSQPYLGAACEFQEREAGQCPVLNRISLLGAAATLSTGPMFGGLNGIKFLLERVVEQICKALFLENLEVFYHTFENGLQAPKPPGAMGSTD